MPRLDAIPSGRLRRAAAPWVAGLCLLVIAGGVHWAEATASLHIPATPVDQVNVAASRQWMLLMQAKELIPPGSSYTVAAATPDDEMALFMLSVGVLTGRRAEPRSYYGKPTALRPTAARYVVSYECAGQPAEGTRHDLLNGCVWDTGARRN